MNFEFTFKALKPDNFAFYMLQLQVLTGELLNSSFCFVYVLLLKCEIILDTVF
jgi:hypothetical protein